MHPTRVALATISVSIIVLSVILAHPVRGQTPPGTATAVPSPTSTVLPTSTPTGGYPSAASLIAASDAAQTAQNSYHTDETINLSGGGRISKVHIVSDTSLKPSAAHSVMTQTDTVKKTGKVTTTRAEAYLVKQKIAMRQGTTAWQCTTLDKLLGSSGGAVSELTSALAESFQHIFDSAQTVGPVTIGSVPTWDVRVDTAFASPGPTMPLVIDMYISQSDNLLIRMTISIHMTIQGTTLTEHMKANYSKYGEKLKITLPAACKGKAVAQRVGVFSPLTTPLYDLHLWMLRHSPAQWHQASYRQHSR